MKITKLKVNKFRNLHDIEVPIANRLTAIAGQNGTSKTAILGLLSHVFTYPAQHKTIAGKPFYSIYSEVFRFSFPHYDRVGEHDYTVYFDDNTHIDVLSAERKLKKSSILRLKVGKKTGKGKISGGSKIKKPVAYFGMRRFYPFAQETYIKHEPKSLLTGDELNYYQELHKEILLMNESITASRIKTRNKEYYAPQSDRYDYLGISAGQDNIGQFITSVLSFKRLKSELRDQYTGGAIFIDELDATLFPGSQLKMVRNLDRIAKELSLQIIFTTHSLEILEEVQKFTGQGQSHTIYLDKNRSRISVKQNHPISLIRNDLRVAGPISAGKSTKKQVYCEDDVAKAFADNVLSAENKQKIRVCSAKLGEGTLQTIAGKFDELNEVIFLVDGDVQVRNGRVVCLPGPDCPEKMAYDFLQSLSIDDDFWGDSDNGYTKQFCFSNCLDNSNKKRIKSWYDTQKQHWGRNQNKLWKKWSGANNKATKEFNNNLSARI